MASSLYSGAAPLGTPLLFSPRTGAAAFLSQISALPKLAGVTAASRLEVRPAPAMVSSGIAELDAFTGGLPRGCLTEICGVTSSGRTSLMLAALAAATNRGEVCALVDSTDALDPPSAAAAGVMLSRLLWVRCGDNHPPRRHGSTEKNRSRKSAGKFQDQETGTSWNEFRDRLEQALRVIDLLLQSGGFGLIAMDFGDVPFTAARRVPLTTWFRFQRAIENTPAVLLLIAEAACAQTCAAMVVRVRASAKKLSAISSQLSERKLSAVSSQLSVKGPCHTQRLGGIEIEAELVRSRLERRPMGSVSAKFASRRTG
jgi:recA bacterial DNA recombination protein